MNKTLIWMSAFVFSIAFTHTTYAKADLTNGTRPPCACMHAMSKTLDLTEDQQAQIKKIRVQSSIVRHAERNDLLTIHNQIQELSRADKLDEQKLNILLDQKKEITVRAIKNKMLARDQIYSILNAQQKIKYDEMMKQWEKTKMEKATHAHDSLAP